MSKLFTTKAHAAKAALREQQKQFKTKLAVAHRPEVKAAWALIPPALRKNVNVSLASYGHGMYLSCWLRELDSFKDKRLVKLLEKFDSPEWCASTSDYTYDAPNRDFRFVRVVHPTDGFPQFDITVCFYTYVKSDSPLCRIEVKEVVEEVKREIRQIICA